MSLTLIVYDPLRCPSARFFIRSDIKLVCNYAACEILTGHNVIIAYLDQCKQ